MNKKLRRKGLLLAPFLFLWYAWSLQACSQDDMEQGVPFVLVNETVNLRSPLYANLKVKKWAYLPDAGARGILLVKDNDFTYRAYDRFCPYRIEDSDCGLVEANPLGAGLDFVCNCGGCKSTFSWHNGAPRSGPAKRMLQKYKVTMLTDGLIRITNH
ncbi:MAG: hypothetical protein MI784_15350 [Cytophagales bacterium]|nr:hypothetical protein [Cytophagales bacterium]